MRAVGFSILVVLCTAGCEGLLMSKETRARRNSFGMAPLHLAAMVGQVALLQALLDAGAKVNLEGPEGATALSLAATSGHAPAVAALGRSLRARER